MSGRRPHSMFGPYGFVPFDGTMHQVPFLQHQPVFFSPASSVGSIPAMMEVQQESPFFRSGPLMSPLMMMSPPPTQPLPSSTPPQTIAIQNVNQNFTGPVMRNSMAISDNMSQQFRLVYQPMLVRYNGDGSRWQGIDDGAPPDVVGDFRHEEMDMNYQGENSFMHFQPDVIQVPAEAEPTYINNQSNNEQPSYSNQFEQNIQTGFSNQSGSARTPQRDFTQTLPSPRSQQRSAFNRGSSLPPQLQAQQQQLPVAPPRSRRGSRRGSMLSLVDSSLSLDVEELTDKLRTMSTSTSKSTHPVNVEKNPPSRPPRRKDRIKKSQSNLFGGLSAIVENEAADKEHLIEKSQTLSQFPVVPMPGTDKASLLKRATSVIESRVKPVVPMPGTISSSKSTSDIIQQGGSSKVTNQPDEPRPASAVPRIPMPTGNPAPHRCKSENIDFRLATSVPEKFPFGLEPSGSSLARIGDGVYDSTPSLEESVPKVSTFTSPLDHEDFGSRSNSRLSSVAKSTEESSNVYALANKKSDSTRSLSGIRTEVEEEGERTPRNQQEFMDESSVREEMTKAFHAAFFGIRPTERFDPILRDNNSDEEAPPVKQKSIVKIVKKNRKGYNGETEKSDFQEVQDTSSDMEQSNAVKDTDLMTLPDGVIASTDEDSGDLKNDVEDDDVTVGGESDHDTVEEFLEDETGEGLESDKYNELVYKAVGATWDEVPGIDAGLPPPLILHSQLRSMKLDLLSSIFQGLYPTELDCALVCSFMSSPASLEEKYTMIRLSDILKRNKRLGVELEALAEAMSQLAKIGQELMRPEDDRDPMWRTIPVAKEIMVSKGIACRAPWENIQGGREILESLGYTEYTGFALQYPRSMMPEFFADHIGNLTVELVLAAVEISTLLIRVRPSLETLAVLQEAEAFPGNDAEVYYPEVPMLSQVDNRQDLDKEVKPVLPEENKKIPLNEEFEKNGRRHLHESEYEEIELPSLRSTSKLDFPNNVMVSNTTCDLCGTSSATIQCQQCTDQVFCSSCDEMYHKHPKRNSHQRESGSKVAPRGDLPTIRTPSAPPRRSFRNGSTPDSPNMERELSSGSKHFATKEVTHEISRSNTLPRQLSGPMIGRPLPPPPSLETPGLSTPSQPSDKGEVHLKRSQSLATSPPALPTRAPVPVHPPIEEPDKTRPQMPKKTLNIQQNGFGGNKEEISTPAQCNNFAPYPVNRGYQQQHQHNFTPQGLNTAHHHQQNHPSQSQFTPQFPPRDQSRAKSVQSQMAMNQYPQTFPDADPNHFNNGFNMNMGQENQWQQNSQMHPNNGIAFSNHQSFQAPQIISGHSASKSRGKNRFSKLNKSSSLHDIVQGIDADQNFANPVRGMWDGQHWAVQSQVHAPPFSMGNMMEHNGNFKRTTSTKSLHQLNDYWGNFDTDSFMMQQRFGNQIHPNFNPMMNPWIQTGPQMFNQMGSMAGNGHLHRSMHELNFGPVPNIIPKSPVTSQKSSRSKKSNTKLTEQKQTNSRNRRKAGSTSCSQGRTSKRHSHKRSESSDDEDVQQASSEEDEEEDFYTGESESEFEPQSSNLNSRRTSRKSWVCEHCTYVNNPGVKICTVCCRTSKMHRYDEEPNSERSSHSVSKDSSHGKSKSSKSGQKYQNRNKYNSSDEESDEAPKPNRKKGSSTAANQKKRASHKAKSPRPKTPENGSGLEGDGYKAYYDVRREHKSFDGPHETPSSSSTHYNPPPRMVSEPPLPAKGILKKSNSNPQLTKIEQDAKRDVSQLTRQLEQQMAPTGSGKVADIQKYLAQTKGNPKIVAKNLNGFGDDEESTNWTYQDDSTRAQQQQFQHDYSPARSVASDTGRAYGSQGMQEQLFQDQTRLTQRRASDVGGKKNFRSKRFSRHVDRDPAVRRSQSLQVEIPSDGDRWSEVQSGLIKQRHSNNSESSNEETTIHFTATVESETSGPRGIGSYLSRLEFGNVDGNEGEEVLDSPGSSDNHHRDELPLQGPMESFTMSVDRGFLGRVPNEHGSIYRSMENLTAQKATGLELVRLLREAEQSGFTAEDIQVSLNHCGDANPVSWLKENWDNMMDTVVTLASNVGHEAEENTIGTLSKVEAKDALRKHKGNIWASVTECVEQRQLKYDDLCSRGNFTREDIVTVLTAYQGNIEEAFQELNKATLKPFLIRLWGQEEQPEVKNGILSAKEQSKDPDAIILADKPEDEPSYHPGNNVKIVDGPPKQTVQNQPEENQEKFQFDRQVRRLLAEGRISSYEKGEMVVKLQNLEFQEDEALVAVEQCDDIYTATKFLRQECELCANIMNVKEITSMPVCDHKCCRDCAAKHFTIVIKDRSIGEARCPFCHEPSGLSEPNDDSDAATAYFAKLDILLKSILEQDVHDLFQRKLRDRTLMKDPNFKWCYKCSSGFIADPRNKKLVCPDCRAISCAKCLKPWEAQHEGIPCDEFAAWKDANDPDNQAKGLERHLEENGIECPSCKFKYALTKGGCMHFTCSQCKHEFCIGCNKPFKLGVKCGKGPACAKMGLHSHHPRNCLFYLRDKEPEELQKLLMENKVDILGFRKIDNEEDQEGGAKCPVQIQRELGDGLFKDEPCSEEAPKDYAGFCKIHFVEYLCGLIFRNNVDPVSLLDLGELQQVFARANHFMPRQRPGEYEYQYKLRLSQVIQKEIPLESS